MCEGISLQDFISTVPEHLRPSNEEYVRIVSQFMEEREEQDVITIDDFSNIKVCCEAIVDFFESVIIPDLILSKNFTGTMESLRKLFVVDMLSSDCEFILKHPLFQPSPQEKEMRERKANEKRWYGDGVWWRLELERCIAGEDFDFFNHSLER